MKPFNHFTDKYGRHMRIVWRGINYLRLQDNRGRNYLLTYKALINLL